METSTKQAQQAVRLRPGAAGDAEVLGQICYEAFRHISEAHGFPPDFPSAEPAIGLMQMMLGSAHIYSVVAENGDGEVAGSNFLWELDTVSGVGPITIDPEQQNSAMGRRLMEDVIRRSDERGFPSIRLVRPRITTVRWHSIQSSGSTPSSRSRRSRAIRRGCGSRVTG